ncbi:MAG: hypothetical protein KF760_07745 [Candidatus Eremiobacteraeota bacterium]|nr:hypothetical protein [Candidatus Eremiobacteraeota bacterium]MCW5871102.1 hypothetical protein [Candidatus Eremiobacteraeota bacterium]
MAIPSNSVSSNYNQVDVRQTRRLDTDQKIREATLTSSQELSPGEIQAHQNFYNKTVGDVDGVRNGIIGDCAKIDPSIWDKIFPGRNDDKRVEDATAPHLFDNKKAKDVRSDYQKAYREAKRERARAEREVEKLGPGEHTLSNGDKVKVSENPFTGKKTVTTTRPDGTTKTVSYDPKNPNSVDVKTTNPDGTSSELHQKGTEVSKSTTDTQGKTTKDSYHLDLENNPVKETTGPGEDDYTKITANDDGSTDTRTEIYKEDGVPVYEDKHEKPGWLFPHPPIHPHPPILPHPWWRARNPEDDFDRHSIPGLRAQAQ